MLNFPVNASYVYAQVLIWLWYHLGKKCSAFHLILIKQATALMPTVFKAVSRMFVEGMNLFSKYRPIMIPFIWKIMCVDVPSVYSNNTFNITSTVRLWVMRRTRMVDRTEGRVILVFCLPTTTGLSVSPLSLLCCVCSLLVSFTLCLGPSGLW